MSFYFPSISLSLSLSLPFYFPSSEESRVIPASLSRRFSQKACSVGKLNVARRNKMFMSCMLTQVSKRISLRSKRFRLVSDRGGGFLVLTAREMKREFTCAIFRAVFDSRSLFFAHRPHRNACYTGYKRTYDVGLFLFLLFLVLDREVTPIIPNVSVTPVKSSGKKPNYRKLITVH